MATVTTPTIGVNLTTKVAGTGASFDQGNQFKLGTKVNTTDGGTYMYVHASAAITQYDCVAIDENFEATPVTAVQALDGWFCGFAQVAFSDNDFGWVAISGSNINCSIITGVAADTTLGVPMTSLALTAGSLINYKTSHSVRVAGIVGVAASATSVSVTPEIIATSPRFAGQALVDTTAF